MLAFLSRRLGVAPLSSLCFTFLFGSTRGSWWSFYATGWLSRSKSSCSDVVGEIAEVVRKVAEVVGRLAEVVGAATQGSSGLPPRLR